MTHARFKPGSSARQQCLNIVDYLNHLATTAGSGLDLFKLKFLLKAGNEIFIQSYAFLLNLFL